MDGMGAPGDVLCADPNQWPINDGTRGDFGVMQQLSQSDILRICSVLEDCIDQLTILGLIMPVSYEERADATSNIGNDIDLILKGQKQVESKYQDLMTSRSEDKEAGRLSTAQLTELGEQIQEVAADLKRSSQLFNMSLKQNPLSAGNLAKVQTDRQFALDVITNALKELHLSGTFLTLLDVIEREKQKKINMQNAIIREEEGRRKIKALRNHLQNLRKEKEAEQQNKNEMIAHLKDQVQEMKAKTSMEGKYMKRDAELQIQQTQKKCASEEHKLKEEVQLLKSKIDQETRVHLEIEKFLRQNQADLEEKLEFWMEKYDKDIEAKQSELISLKSSKTSNLQRLKEYSEKYLTYERVIIEDRVEKENECKRRTQEEKEFRSIIKLQSWWRGVMVRRGIGIYKNIKKKAENKGKAKGKGKEDDKKKKKKK
ncbi:dynein regulatory complex protein 9 isoform X1 [Pristis pectinata]|uniref:dynein regulatory complex protein 9 isoform X1 n=1 Tax=Pristis pectinata TaxID=685728 RepID=UPI00223E1771|nr:dynein regulatory complex protein 9 isoform X1 [Pristis pectinata]XP_051874849.1 dynein regulatory complex protein 9 isoform X1 [Pristis pectinata]